MTTKTIEQLIAEVAERDATIASLQATIGTQEKTVNTVQASLSDSVAKVTKLETDLAAVTKAKSDFEAQTCSLKADLESSAASLKSVNDELGTMKAAAKRTERLATVASKLKTKTEDAAKLVDSTVALSDEAFASHIELMASTIASLTPAPVAPAAPKTEPAIEEDAAEANADPAVLESAAASVKPGVASVGETDEVSNVRASIEEYLSKSK